MASKQTGYSKNINSNVQILTADQVVNILQYMNIKQYSYASGLSKYRYGKPGTNNIRIEGLLPDDSTNSYIVKNTDPNKLTYNIYDIIAGLKSVGRTDSQIAEAFDKASVNGLKWDEALIKDYNKNTTASTKQIQEYLDIQYPNSNVIVQTTLDPTGDKYNISISFVDPTTNTPVNIPLENVGVDRLEDSDLQKLISENIGNKANNLVINSSNIAANNKATSEFVDKFQAQLNTNVGTSANSNHTLTDADKAAITAALPSTDNLKAWETSNSADIYNTVIKNLQKDNPQLLERMTLTERQGLANAITGAQQNIINRNINTQMGTVLNNINNDPELYKAITNQLRTDNAAGTIAGQRAANAQAIAAESDATYDKQAADLYKSLFGGEQNKAQQSYSNEFTANTTALNDTIQGAIDDAIVAQRQGAITLQEYNTILTGLAAAADVDASVFANAVAERQAAAGGKATDLSAALQSNVKSDIAADDSNLDYLQGLYSDETKWLNNASDGSADVTDPTKALIEKLLNSPKKYNYTTVNTGDYENAEQFNNKHYTDLVNSEFIQTLLSDTTIDNLTKAKTLADFTNNIGTAAGIDDLSKEGLISLYDDYNQKATQESNKVFNAAQRAYIAAITAGDTKTAEQLTKLASNASTSKGNLYAASALANQFKQQFNSTNNSRQLATDFLNQRDTNTANAANATTQAGTVWDSFLGNGSNNYNQGTIYDAYNLHAGNAATAKDIYGKFGNSIMGTTQKLNDSSVTNSIQNFNRLKELGKEYTIANATVAANKTANQSTKDNLKASAEALDRMANPNKYK